MWLYSQPNCRNILPGQHTQNGLLNILRMREHLKRTIRPCLYELSIQDLCTKELCDYARGVFFRWLYRSEDEYLRYPRLGNCSSAWQLGNVSSWFIFTFWKYFLILSNSSLGYYNAISPFPGQTGKEINILLILRSSIIYSPGFLLRL